MNNDTISNTALGTIMNDTVINITQQLTTPIKTPTKNKSSYYTDSEKVTVVYNHVFFRMIEFIINNSAITISQILP